MKFFKRTVKLHRNKSIYILIPKEVCNSIIATNTRGYHIILSNGTGYSSLSEIFKICFKLRENEILFYKFNFLYNDDFLNRFGDKENYYSGFVASNYCSSRFSTKNIIKAINTSYYKTDEIEINDKRQPQFIDHWKTKNRLNVKAHGKLLFFSTNSDGYMTLANSYDILAEYGDDIQFNDYSPHQHHDWEENTAKSIGITFYYWQNY